MTEFEFKLLHTLEFNNSTYLALVSNLLKKPNANKGGTLVCKVRVDTNDPWTAVSFGYLRTGQPTEDTYAGIED